VNFAAFPEYVGQELCFDGTAVERNLRRNFKLDNLDLPLLSVKFEEKPPAAIRIKILKLFKERKVELSSTLLVCRIHGGSTPEIRADLICRLQYSQLLPHDLDSLHGLFVDLAFTLKDDHAHVHLVTLDVFHLIRLHNCAFSAGAIPYLISGIPQVRYRTLLAVSHAFVNEVGVVRRIISEIHLPALRRLFLRSMDLIEQRKNIDERGEPLTILVDEFFIIRECLFASHRPFDFSPYSTTNLQKSDQFFSRFCDSSQPNYNCRNRPFTTITSVGKTR
jgi:hypothetical protein